MSKTVFVYTMDTCPYCLQMKELLDESKVVYTERNCDDYEMQYALLVDHTKNEFIPAIEIRDDEKFTKRYLTPDRDFHDLPDAVTLIKEYL
jgi:glutaredoxin